jgi:hypothetical protein
MIDPRSVAADHGPGETPSPGHRYLNDRNGSKRAIGRGVNRYVVVNAKVLLDSADALQEVIDFFREARDVLGSDFKCVDPKTDVFELGLNVCKPFAHLNA